MENSRPDASTVQLMAQAAENEKTTVRPEEPSLPPVEWALKNLFGVGQGGVGAILRSSILSFVFAAIAILGYRALLNFIFSENTNWDSVRINLRLLFTQAYPEDDYHRVWISLALVLILAGIGLGLMRVGQGVSMKRIATWCLGWGGLVIAGVFLREPSVLVGEDGSPLLTDANGVELARDGLGTLVYPDGSPAPSQGLQVVRESFGDMLSDRTGWLLIGAVLIAVAAGIWFGLGDKRRRGTFIPSIPLSFAFMGFLVSTTWWYNWGNYTFATDEETGVAGFNFEPGVKVAETTRNPWTLMFFILVGAYLLGRRLRGSELESRVKGLLVLGWFLAPFVTFFGILRGPVLDWGYVASVDLPLWLLFAGGGGALMWALTKPGIGELGRIIAVLVLAVAAFTWIGAFFGWFGMLQKIRLSILALGLAGLLAPNFIGETRQRLSLVSGWVGFITIFHVIVTVINTPSSIEVPTEDFAGGFMVSIYVTVFTLLFSFPLGVLLALARTSRLPIFRLLATTYIEAFRGVPLITMLFFFTVFVNLFLPEGMELALLAAVTIAFVLFSAAYLAENVRGGLQSVRRGQYEASDALGLTTVQRTGFIVLPQGLRVSIPPLVGQAIATYKETSLLAIVGVFDFLRMARDIIPNQPEFLGERKPALLFICVIYFIGAYAMSKYSQRLEKNLGVGER
ncbi:MAG: amino acid ABC transporter permease [Actinomycetota bacterium]